jgi:tRNA(Ile)-lysidine synthetase-like protein
MRADDPKISDILPGPWAIGISGGADSVALLTLLRERPDLHLHIVHLNHETRGPESDADADFVSTLASQAGLPCTVARLSDIECNQENVPNNPSARYRAARLSLFSQVVNTYHLLGVILAHHADDQAETILHRLLRGGAPATLAGIRPHAHIGDLLIIHPLLANPRRSLRRLLTVRNIAWREDATNASPRYLRNRLRHFLKPHPRLRDALLALGSACANRSDWLDRAAPHLPPSFPASALHNLPDPLALHAARRWLLERGAPTEELSRETLLRLLDLSRDAASPPRQHFPGRLLIRRRRGLIDAQQST